MTSWKRFSSRLPARAALTVLAASLMLGAQPVRAGPNGAASAAENGPAPTSESAATEGPFAYTSIKVGEGQTPGSFGGVTIWYPISTATTYGGITMSPGFLAPRENLNSYGRLLASHGFVAMAVDPNSPFAEPADRGRVLLAALDWLVTSSPVKSRVDPARQAVFGHSMGGGGVMEAAQDRPTLKAGVAFEPYNDRLRFDTPVPIGLIGGEKDTVAPPKQYAIPMYERLTSRRKSYIEIDGRDHDSVGQKVGAISTALVAWMKLWVDGDRRYAPLVCPGPEVDDVTVSDYRSTCPL